MSCTCNSVKFVPPFDPGFKPAFLKLRALREAAAKDPAGTVVIAIERDNGAVNRYDLPYPKSALECDGFACFVQEGQKVKAGDKLLTFDRKKIAAAGHPDMVAVLLTNADDFASVQPREDGPVTAGRPIIRVTR